MSEKIRKGNDIRIGWSLFDADEHPYNLEGRNIAIELDVLTKRVRIPSFSVSGNTVTFTYYGKDQKYTGSYALKFIENEGSPDMVTFDTKDAFVLVEHSWLAVDAGETPETIQVEVVTLSSELNSNIGPKGDPGDPAGFGSVTADVDTETGSPSVEVTTSGPNTAKNFHFAFSGLKGEDGRDGMDGKDGKDGQDGQDGQDGASAYEIAVEHGYVGTEEEWLASLHGADGKDGSDADVTAQNIANALGYTPADANDVPTAEQKAAWDAKYNKPQTGIPASDLASGVIPDTSQFITKSVSDLVNYYLKSDTYTKAEVQALIGAIQSFHYEVAASTSAVTNPQSNVLYLIGPTGTGEDKYEEYVYPDAQTGWTKIGDTSIDLSGYVTTSALNTALADYTTTADLTTLLSGKADKSEMSVTDGTGADADKTTIQLKSGTSATVLKSHQDISGKEDSSNKVTSLSSSSTDAEYPSAKCVYDALPSTMTGAGASSAGTGGLVPAPSAGDNEKFLRGDGTWQTAGGGGSVTPTTSWSNPPLDTNIPSEKLVYDSLYKRGVISQTQTWTRAADGGYDYVMSDLVYGNIPQANIDLFVAAGATFNATSGYFELNGLTDISYEEMQQIYKYHSLSLLNLNDRMYLFNSALIRTVFELQYNESSADTTGIFRFSSIEVAGFHFSANGSIGNATSICSVAKYFKRFSTNLECKNVIGNKFFYAFYNCFSLETANIKNLKANISFDYSPRLSVASILYMIQNEAATSAITITLHATAYARATADADVTAALQNHPNITLASA